MGFVKPTDTPGQPLNVIYAEHILQLIYALLAQRDAGQLSLLGQVSAPETAPTVTLSAGQLTGSYEWGTYWITGIEDGTGAFSVTGRTTASPYSAAQNLANQQGTISISGQVIPTGVVGWGVVRNQAGGGTWYEVPGSEQFMNSVGVMPTSFVDDAADGNLVTAAPSTNTTGTSLSGTIDATTLGGILATDYFRTDSGAPNPQTVANPVNWQGFQSLNSGAVVSATGGADSRGSSSSGIAFGWDYTSGQGEGDIFIYGQGGTGGLNVYNTNASQYPTWTQILGIDGSGNMTAFGSANESSNKVVNVISPDGSYVSIIPSIAQGSYNGLAQAGDQAIIFSSKGASANPSYLTIAPWYGSSAGIRIGSDGSLAAINPTFSGAQVFTASGTFTVPTGVKRVYVQVWGAGGGGGLHISGNGDQGAAGGGGGGGYSDAWIEVSSGQQISVTVGAGGAEGSGGATGGTGGTSSFGSYIVATGGGGGQDGNYGSRLGGAAGSGTTGITKISGVAGTNGDTTTGVDGNGGNGATDYGGSGGVSGGNPTAPGGGGSGGGTAGANGQIRVYY